MTNLEKYVNAFVETFEIDVSETEGLEYQIITNWDSVGHMSPDCCTRGYFRCYDRY